MSMRDRPGAFVHRPGLLTTVQDLGRYGYQRYGVSVSGAMDRTALRIGNRIVGNPDGEAGLEVTLQGPELEFGGDVLIAVTGADLTPTLNGDSIPMWTAVKARPGDFLRFGPRRQGSRAYLCFKGGIDVPRVFGSRSTDVRAAIGGLDGRRLGKGDQVSFGIAVGESSRTGPRQLPIPAQPMYHAAPALRVVPGPQAEQFLPKARDVLFTSLYAISTESDRMGFRLNGPAIPRRRPAELISDATAAGTIQVPADRSPILLMVDCQTTGGYPKIAAVITVDMAQAGQLAPGDHMTFAPIAPDDAALLCRTERAKLDRLLPPIAPGLRHP